MTDWRSWWADRGERELRDLLRECWPPRAQADDAVCARNAVRLSTLLGSRAPVPALAAELGRIRSELGAGSNPGDDLAAATRVRAWFPAGSVGAR